MWYVGPGPLEDVAPQKKKMLPLTGKYIRTHQQSCYGVRITVCNASKMVNKQPWTANKGASFQFADWTGLRRS